MKRLIIIFLYLGTIFSSFGQEIKINKATEKDLLVSANSLHSVNEFSGRLIAIKVIEVESITQHPDNESQDAAVSDFLITVKEIIDDKNSNADFWVLGQFFNPRNFEFDPADKVFSFQHGTEINTKTTRLEINTKEIRIK